MRQLCTQAVTSICCPSSPSLSLCLFFSFSNRKSNLFSPSALRLQTEPERRDELLSRVMSHDRFSSLEIKAVHQKWIHVTDEKNKYFGTNTPDCGEGEALPFGRCLRKCGIRRPRDDWRRHATSPAESLWHFGNVDNSHLSGWWFGFADTRRVPISAFS